MNYGKIEDGFNKKQDDMVKRLDGAKAIIKDIYDCLCYKMRDGDEVKQGTYWIDYDTSKIDECSVDLLCCELCQEGFMVERKVGRLVIGCVVFEDGKNGGWLYEDNTTAA